MKRDAELLQFLLRQRGFVTIEELAGNFSVTTRTVRLNLDSLESFLKELDITLLRDRKKGVSLDLGGKSRQEVLSAVSKSSGRNFYYTKEERQNIILDELLLSEAYVTLDFLAEKTLASKNTTIADLSACEEWLKQYGIALERRPGFGIRMVCREKDFRTAAYEHLLHYIPEPVFYRWSQSGYDMRLVFGLNANRFVCHFFENSDLPAIDALLHRFEADFGAIIWTHAFSKLFLSFCISLKRCALNQFCEPADVPPELTDGPYFDWVKRNYERLGRVPDHELALITQLLLCYSRFPPESQPKGVLEGLERLTRQFVSNVEMQLNVDLSDDSTLFRNLLSHIPSMLYRACSGAGCINPVLKDLQHDYPEILSACKNSAAVFRKLLHTELNADELSLLAIHVAAAVEKKKHQPANLRRYKAISVCVEGVGVGHMLRQRLGKEFPEIDVVHVTALEGLDSVSKADIDFIISTIPLYYEGCTVITVSPLVGKQDVLKIRRAIEQLSAYPDAAHKDIAKDVVDIVVDQCGVARTGQLEQAISSYFDRLFSPSPKELDLSALLSPTRVALHVEAADWRSAIAAAGELLLKENYIEPHYIEQMIQNKEIYGNYICIAPRVAFPHAKPADGAYKTGLSVITMRNGVDFGNEECDPIQMVICLSTDGSTRHLKALKQLFQVLEQDENILRLLREDDPWQFVQEFLRMGQGQH